MFCSPSRIYSIYLYIYLSSPLPYRGSVSSAMAAEAESNMLFHFSLEYVKLMQTGSPPYGFAVF